MNLLVGATGFIGGHLVEYLFQQGEISKGTFRKGAHLKVLDQSGVQLIESDLLDHHSLHEAAEGADVVFSLASPMPGDGEDFKKVNSEGLLNLLEVSQEMKVKSLVHLSTLDVLGFGAGEVTAENAPDPAGDYQTAKAGAERLLMEHAKRNPMPRIVIIRAAKAVGPGEPSFINPALRMMASGKVVVPRSRMMSWTHPRDIGQAMLKAALSSSASGRVYLLKSFDSTAEDLARNLVGAVGSSASVGTAGVFSKSGVTPYAADQVRASLRFQDQASWNELPYRPEFDEKRTCEEIALWHKKEPWAAEAS